MKRINAKSAPRSPPGDIPTATGVSAGEGQTTLSKLRSRLAEAEDTLRAIRHGEVDAVVTVGKNGPQVFTLEGADHAYRVLIESMNEGALTLTREMTILYANQCFARMVQHPLEQVTGSSIRRFLSAAECAILVPHFKRTTEAGSKIQVDLQAGDGSRLPVQISLRFLARQGANRATVGMVVTDITETRRTEELLRTLTHRVMQAQEAERRHLALELHDHITQLVCATLFRSQTLAAQLSTHGDGLKHESIKLREMLGQTAAEVERISRGLRPSVLDELGLAVVLRTTTKEFAERTGLSVKLSCVPLLTRLPPDTELTLYRIVQEALRNIEQHAQADHVTVRLTQPGDAVQLMIRDDGIGFDADQPSGAPNTKVCLGLLSMRERAIWSGGALSVKSVRRTEKTSAHTTIKVRIPRRV